MCFSAPASFITASVTLVAGIVAIRKAKENRQLALAFVPIIFTFQQTAEGFLWVALSDGVFSVWKEMLTHSFLIFAQVVWPFWVPFCFYLAAKDVKRKRILEWLMVMGILVAFVLLYCLTVYPVDAAIAGKHIYYLTHYPRGMDIAAIFYFIAVVVPPFVSDLKWAWVIGFLIFASYVVSRLFFREHVISVWCFIAALISVLVVLILQKNSKVAGGSH